METAVFAGRAWDKGDVTMRYEDYIHALATRVKHKVDNIQTRSYIRAWILFLEAEMKTDYYAFRLDWRWMLR